MNQRSSASISGWKCFVFLAFFRDATGAWFAVSHFELSRPEFFVSLWRNAAE